MPRTNINYTQTNFYTVACKDLNIKHCYIGYTTYFKRRANEHSRKSQRTVLTGPNAMLYDFVKKNGNWSNFDMILIETRPCDGSLDAKRIRWDFIVALGATLNGPIRTLTEKLEHSLIEIDQDSSSTDTIIEHVNEETEQSSVFSPREELIDNPNASSSTDSILENEKVRELGGGLWCEVLKQATAFDLVSDEDEKVKSRLKFWNLIKYIEAMQTVHDKSLEEHIQRGGSKREFSF